MVAFISEACAASPGGSLLWVDPAFRASLSHEQILAAAALASPARLPACAAHSPGSDAGSQPATELLAVQQQQQQLLAPISIVSEAQWM